jgi:replicative DNA helicase Mcm
MSEVQASTFTESALSDKVKDFLNRFKDKFGNYKYLQQIDEMMPRNSKYIIVDYNDLVIEPELERIFSKDPDRIFNAFSRAIKEALQTRFTDYAEKIKDEVRVRLVNYPSQRSLRQINSETIGYITSVSGMVVRASEVKPLAKELIFVCPDGHHTQIVQLKGMDVKLPIVCDNPNCKYRDLQLDKTKSDFEYYRNIYLKDFTNADHNSDTLVCEAQGELIQQHFSRGHAAILKAL